MTLIEQLQKVRDSYAKSDDRSVTLIVQYLDKMIELHKEVKVETKPVHSQNE